MIGVDMRPKLKAIVGLIGAALVAGLFVVSPAAGETVIHLVLPRDGLTVKFVDIDHDGLRLGDRAAARGRLVDANASDRVGTAYFECLVQKRIVGSSQGLFNCTYVLHLADGDIILQGLDPRGEGASEFAVLGGTGAYGTATGDATFTDTESTTDIVIRLAS
ncbi:MAG TPA: hypothetical protein VHK89_07385 [Actinomycetota bacterium]|nr:hypothetical protein [Actinomycetota bacterium]